jgi:hypothetical protein
VKFHHQPQQLPRLPAVAGSLLLQSLAPIPPILWWLAAVPGSRLSQLLTPHPLSQDSLRLWLPAELVAVHCQARRQPVQILLLLPLLLPAKLSSVVAGQPAAHICCPLHHHQQQQHWHLAAVPGSLLLLLLPPLLPAEPQAPQQHLQLCCIQLLQRHPRPPLLWLVRQWVMLAGPALLRQAALHVPPLSGWAW